VVPPLALDTGDIASEVHVVGQLAKARRAWRAGRYLTRVAELVHVARTAVWAIQQERDAGLRRIAARETVLPVSPKRPHGASRNRCFCNGIAFSEIMNRQRRSRKGSPHGCGGIRSDPGTARACEGVDRGSVHDARAGPLRSGTPREDQ